jgi:hypothetical protein
MRALPLARYRRCRNLPRIGPRLQIAMIFPRLRGRIKSPNEPAPIVMGQPPNVPARKRKTTNAGKEGDNALATLKTVNRMLQTQYTGTRPYSSDSGPRNSGPKKSIQESNISRRPPFNVYRSILQPRIHTETTNDASKELLD